MDVREKNNLVRETIEFPVRYDHTQQIVWDSKGMMVCDIRGWGKIQFMDRAEERQDAIGEKIAKLLNESGADTDNAELEYEESREISASFSGEKVVHFEWD